MGIGMGIGIDPGVNGGIAVINFSGVTAYKMPKSRKELIRLIMEKLPVGAPLVIEKQWARPSPAEMKRRAGWLGNDKKQGRGTVATGKLMKHYGELLGILDTLDHWKVQEVSPQKWQKVMGANTGGDKNRSKAEAQARFPGYKVTLWNADALLLAEYARLFYGVQATLRQAG